MVHESTACESRGTHERSERLQVRLSVRQKQILEDAAAIEGRTLTDFVLSYAQAAAQRTIQEHLVLSLSQRDGQRVMDALLSPWQPSSEIVDEIRQMRYLFDRE